jgi:thiol:disulfide interchange protein DsbD
VEGCDPKPSARRHACSGAPLALLLLLASDAAVAAPVRVRAVEAELVAEQRSMAPGRPLSVALRLVMDPTWHTYWANPGDSGLPTTIRWKLPDGFSAGPIEWPYPQRFEHPPYVSYGYEGEVLLMSEIRPPADLATGNPVVLGARVDWTVCKADICVPGGTDLTLTMPATETTPEADPVWAERFASARARHPRADAAWTAEARSRDGWVELLLRPAEPVDPGDIQVFELLRDSVDHERPIVRTSEGQALTLRIPLQTRLRTPPDRFEAVLLAERHWDSAGRFKALAISVPLTGP